MSSVSTTPFEVNGRRYAPPPRPLVAICLDGSADEYLDAAMARALMPRLQHLCASGFRGMARAAMPTFTNVNNASIITGVPPSVHGISGNFFFDPDTGADVMMNSGSYLRAATIPAAASRAGRRVAVVTAKEKLRHILSHELHGGIAFSAEKAADARRDTHGIERIEQLVGSPAPNIYSADASLFVLRAGVMLLREHLADFLYLSLTDYVQHLHAPESPDALKFYADIDRELGNLIDAGAIVGATADHGMNAKHHADGRPNVIYLESLLREQFGQGVRVVLPITDPYVKHHGAFGSFAVVHVPAGGAARDIAASLMSLDGITEVYDRATAARKLELPADRIGDLVVLSGRNVVLGRTPADHDLSQLDAPLRSHGGRYEEMVPMVLSDKLSNEYFAKASAGDPRNFDLFEFLMNGTPRS